MNRCKTLTPLTILLIIAACDDLEDFELDDQVRSHSEIGDYAAQEPVLAVRPVEPEPEPEPDPSECPSVYSCTIDAQSGETNCDSTYVSANNTFGDRWVGRANMLNPECEYRRMDIYAQVCDPTGWNMHVTDSPTANGWGGDGASTDHDAEFYFNGRSFQFYSTYSLPSPGVPSVHTQVNRYQGECETVHMATWHADGAPVSHIRVEGAGDRTQIQSERGLRLGYEACANANVPRGTGCDWEDNDLSDAGKWYFGLNRTVGSAHRSGTGVLAACVTLSSDVGATPEDCFGDQDGDGLLDADDPLPLDPFPPFIVNANDQGSLDVRLSDGQGGFSEAHSVGIIHSGKGVDYQYNTAAVSDFNDDGRLDFLITDYSSNPEGARSLWWFERSDGPLSFEQREIDSDVGALFAGYTTDANSDGVTDLYNFNVLRNNGWVSGLEVLSLTTSGDPATAGCAWTDDPNNPNGCLFVRTLGADYSPWFSGQWAYAFAQSTQDLDQDGLHDLVFSRMAHGGNAATPVAFAAGLGGGDFSESLDVLVNHNSNAQSSPVAAINLADFTGDGVADVLTGCDDDGDAGSIWLYPGYLEDGEYGLAVDKAMEVIDTGSYGRSCRLQPYDFDLDGDLDLIVGYNFADQYSAPTRLSYYENLGGEFAAPTVLGDYGGTGAWRVGAPVFLAE